jgi:Sec-independent protein translocase protein TatA
MTTWLVLTLVVVLVLGGVIVLLPRFSRDVKAHIGTMTPYTDYHAKELQQRVANVNDFSVAHRASLERSLKRFDEELSAETRAMRATLDAEVEEERNADATRHGR